MGCIIFTFLYSFVFFWYFKSVSIKLLLYGTLKNDIYFFSFNKTVRSWFRSFKATTRNHYLLIATMIKQSKLEPPACRAAYLLGLWYFYLDSTESVLALRITSVIKEMANLLTCCLVYLYGSYGGVGITFSLFHNYLNVPSRTLMFGGRTSKFESQKQQLTFSGTFILIVAFFLLFKCRPC